MKIKLGPTQPDSLPFHRGSFYTRDTIRGPVIQAWPRKGKRKFTTAQKQWQTRFGFAAIMAANPFPLDYLTAIEMTKGTTQVPRDVLTAAAMGRYYEIVDEDGTVWGHVPGALHP